MLPRRVRLLILMAAVTAAPLCAQSRFEIGPIFGYYRPTGTFSTATVSVSDAWAPARASVLAAVAWGGQLRWWFGKRFGVEVQAADARTHSSGFAGGYFLCPGLGCYAPPSPPMPRSVLMGSALLLYDVSPAPERYRVWLAAGPGFVQHRGEQYRPFGSPVQSAGVVGLGGSLPLLAHLRATAGISTAMYVFHLRDAGYEIQTGFQTDVLFHVGLMWSPR